MAIAFDAASGSSGTGTSLTYAHTCTGSDRILFVGFFQDGVNDVTGVTYAGVSMTEITPAVERPTDSGFYHLFYLVAPSTGANNIVISKSTSTGIYSNAASYTGASQTGVPDSTASASGKPVSGLTGTTTVVGSTCWTLFGMFCDNSNIQAGASTTIRNGTGTPNAICDSNGVVGTGSQSLIVTSNANSGAAGRIVSFAASGGGATSPKLFTLLGIGT